MNMRIFSSLVVLTMLIGTCYAQEWMPRTGKIEIKNRVLATVNGEPITALDLAERLDLMFVESFPQYAGEPEARFGFFNVNWEALLRELVNDALVRADATEKKIPVTQADVREEMQERFGPHVLETLDSAGLTYERAWELVTNDILVRRMTGYRVNTKAYMRVGPSLVKQAYQEYVDKLSGKMSWRYRAITFRSDDPSKAAAVASRVHDLLAKQEITVESLTNESWETGVDVSVSEEFLRTEADISPIHRDVIQKMETNTVSEPVVQEGRSGPVTRIYFLAEATRPDIIAFNDCAAKVRDQLMSRYVSEEAQTYYAYLRRHFDVEELIGAESPFVWVQ